MILALDLSMHCGWAAGETGSRPRWGTWELPSLIDLPRQAAAFADVLADGIQVHQPKQIILEIDINLHKQNPSGVAEQQIGMAYLAGLICWRRKVPCRRATAMDARRAVLGQTRWAKGDVKFAVVDWAKAMGWDVRDHNEADALVLWKFQCGLSARSAAV